VSNENVEGEGEMEGKANNVYSSRSEQYIEQEVRIRQDISNEE
jgi:hypothetical protein